MILSKCKVESLEEVKNINLWGNELEDVDIIKDLENVEVVSLSVNKIKNLKPFGFCKKLSELYLRKNNISDISEVKHLQNCKNLKILWLEENPICEVKNYRMIVIFLLQNLVKFDNINILPSEREESANVVKAMNLLNSKNENINQVDLEKKRKINSGIYNNKYESEAQLPKKFISESNLNTGQFNTPNLNKNPVQVLENDYMSKFKNLDELTEFFTPSHEKLNYDKYKQNNKVFTFNDSLRGTGTNFNINNNNNHNNPLKLNKNYSTNNIHLIKAIYNLIEELNPTQLNYLRRVIEKKLKGSPDSIL